MRRRSPLRARLPAGNCGSPAPARLLCRRSRHATAQPRPAVVQQKPAGCSREACRSRGGDKQTTPAKQTPAAAKTVSAPRVRDHRADLGTAKRREAAPTAASATAATKQSATVPTDGLDEFTWEPPSLTPAADAAIAKTASVSSRRRRSSAEKARFRYGEASRAEARAEGAAKHRPPLRTAAQAPKRRLRWQSPRSSKPAANQPGRCKACREARCPAGESASKPGHGEQHARACAGPDVLRSAARACRSPAHSADRHRSTSARACSSKTSASASRPSPRRGAHAAQPSATQATRLARYIRRPTRRRRLRSRLRRPRRRSRKDCQAGSRADGGQAGRAGATAAFRITGCADRVSRRSSTARRPFAR